MLKYVYDANIQPDQRAEIERCINKLSWLIPGWCARLVVRLVDESGEGSLASITVDYAYRSATLEIYSKWLTYSADDRLQTILHEILHIHINIIHNYVIDRSIEVFAGQDAPQLHQMLLNGLRERTEMVTEDLSNNISEYLYQKRRAK